MGHCEPRASCHAWETWRRGFAKNENGFLLVHTAGRVGSTRLVRFIIIVPRLTVSFSACGILTQLLPFGQERAKAEPDNSQPFPRRISSKWRELPPRAGSLFDRNSVARAARSHGSSKRKASGCTMSSTSQLASRNTCSATLPSKTYGLLVRPALPTATTGRGFSALIERLRFPSFWKKQVSFFPKIRKAHTIYVLASKNGRQAIC